MVATEFRKDISTDIDQLQLSSSKEVFDKAAALFVKKWMSKKQKEFVIYFKREWVDSHTNWYEGVGHFTPSTNNCLEAFNLVLKKEET
jgi:hypothetical protein